MSNNTGKERKKVQCLNNHFYDSEKYDRCPHCGAEARASMVEPETIIPNKKDLKRTLWSKRKNIEVQEVKGGNFNNDETMGKIISLKDDVQSDGFTDFAPVNDYDLKPGDIIFGDDYKKKQSDKDKEQIDIKQELPDILPKVKSEIEYSNKRKNANNVSALVEDNNRAGNTDGKTFGYFSDGSNEDKQMDPVVGWIVAIKGKYFGESFKLVAGKNSIGRNLDNHICLERDNKVSREKHALITYEPKKHAFYIQAGDSSGLVYLNNEIVMSPQLIKAKDTIEIGTEVFYFVPLCDDEFAWENYLKEK
ncbi:MAG: FHA domain-containing protein [Lachnospiraceae bacterium]